MVATSKLEYRIGDCVDILKEFPADFFDACVTDPPYGLEFMGENWDHLQSAQFKGEREAWQDGLPADHIAQRMTKMPRYHAGLDMGEWHKEWALSVYRVMKPGAHLLAFSGSRTSHWLGYGLEMSGFEIRDQIQWLTFSGWPKGLNVSKAIDQSLGKEPIKVGVRYEHQPIGGEHGGVYGAREGVVIDTKPATPEAAQWEGWNTALKPAAEPIFVARKPLEGTIAENILKWGVGAYNIQACRIPCGTRKVGITAGPGKATVTTFGDGINSTPMVWTEDDLGRWPANVILDEQRAKELDQQSGVSTSKRGEMGVGLTDSPVYGSADPDFKSTRGHDDEGGASRFFQIIDTKAGRYPANVIMDEKAAEELDKQSGISESQRSVRGGFRDGGSMFDTKQHLPIYECGYEDEGGGSRFFYVPKASREEREMGLEKLPPVKTIWSENFGAFKKDKKRRPIRNDHPTVKPIALMQYLIRLVTPMSGLVLDPFLGSGTTLIACRLEGMNGIGIEKNPEYEAIIKGRINALPPAIEGFDSKAFSAPVPSSTSPVQVLQVDPAIARRVTRQSTLEGF